MLPIKIHDFIVKLSEITKEKNISSYSKISELWMLIEFMGINIQAIDLDLDI